MILITEGIISGGNRSTLTRGWCLLPHPPPSTTLVTLVRNDDGSPLVWPDINPEFHGTDRHRLRSMDHRAIADYTPSRKVATTHRKIWRVVSNYRNLTPPRNQVNAVITYVL